MPNDTITNAEVEEILASRSDDWWAKYSELEPTGMRIVVERLASALLEEREAFVAFHKLHCLTCHRNREELCEAAERIQKWEGK